MAFFRSRAAPPAASPNRLRVGAEVAARLTANPAVTAVPIEGVQLFHHAEFLSPAQCDGLVAMIKAKRRPSTLLAVSDDPEFRTSESCDMDRWSPDVRPTDEGIAALLGIDPVHGETMQGQRYAPGQQFRAHTDWFHANTPYWDDMQRTGGQRTWTAMIYLNDVEEGGATWFPQAGVRVAPKRGLLLTWNNMKADGSPNDLTLHEGMPVVAGMKYVITKWFREGAWVQ